MGRPFKNVHYRALVEAEEIAGIIGGRGAKAAKASKTVGVGKRGSAIPSKELVAESGVGDADYSQLDQLSQLTYPAGEL